MSLTPVSYTHLDGYKRQAPYRLHVYAIPAAQWNEKSITWNNAPLLDSKEALLKNVGQKAFVAGEMAFTQTAADHYIDVTELLQKYGAQKLTFVLVRETRQLGDDEDKNVQVFISSKESERKPVLVINQHK